MGNAKKWIVINVTSSNGKSDIMARCATIGAETYQNPQYIIFRDGSIYDINDKVNGNNVLFTNNEDVIYIDLENYGFVTEKNGKRVTEFGEIVEDLLENDGSGNYYQDFTQKQMLVLKVLLKELGETFEVPIRFPKDIKNYNSYKGVLVFSDLYPTNPNKIVLSLLVEKINNSE